MLATVAWLREALRSLRAAAFPGFGRALAALRPCMCVHTFHAHPGGGPCSLCGCREWESTAGPSGAR